MLLTAVERILLTTTAGVVLEKSNAFVDYCVCSNCGYDFRLTKDEIRAARAPSTWDTYTDEVEEPDGTVIRQIALQEIPPRVSWGTMCPACGYWDVYKEFTTVSC